MYFPHYVTHPCHGRGVLFLSSGDGALALLPTATLKAGDTGSARSKLVCSGLRGGDTASILLKSVKLTSDDDTASF